MNTGRVTQDREEAEVGLRSNSHRYQQEQRSKMQARRQQIPDNTPVGDDYQERENIDDDLSGLKANAEPPHGVRKQHGAEWSIGPVEIAIRQIPPGKAGHTVQPPSGIAREERWKLV